MNEELDSQLSAMFDNELPAAECELLARRLSRDEELKGRWALYAAIGATIRSEGGVRLDGNLAGRVSAAISAEPAVTAQSEADASGARLGVRPSRARAGSTPSRWWVPIGGVAMAASVAAAAILWVRFESSPQSGQVMAQSAPATVLGIGQGSDAVVNPDTRASYVVPKVSPRRSMMPSTQLANYVVAHSEFSSPVNRRNLLSTLMASEPGTVGAQSGSDEPTEDVHDDADAKSPQ